jgi:hypothetical protein
MIFTSDHKCDAYFVNSKGEWVDDDGNPTDPKNPPDTIVNRGKYGPKTQQYLDSIGGPKLSWSYRFVHYCCFF